ncbi:hypothetical protein C8R43DRAFT_1031812 [Mycena crocata]|nr:hypothetical protein C8R43DRAFT_1031812 [Mycena crocata]
MLVTLSSGLQVLCVFLLGVSPTSRAASSRVGALIHRQSSTFDPSQIPLGCQDVCSSVVDNANTCTTFQCLCTPKNDAAVLSCVNCVISFNHSGPAIIDGQDILNQFASQCNLNNVSVSSLSASGMATVTGVTTSNLNLPPPSESTTMSSTLSSASVSATSPSVPIPSTSPVTSSVPNRASTPTAGQRSLVSWSSCVALASLVVLAIS